MDSPDDEDAIFDLDFAAHIGCKPAIACINFARLQRAPEGSDHSATRGRDHIVERCGVRFPKLALINPIVPGDRTMDAESDGICLTGELCDTQWPFASLDVHLRNVSDFRHYPPIKRARRKFFEKGRRDQLLSPNLRRSPAILPPAFSRPVQARRSEVLR